MSSSDNVISVEQALRIIGLEVEYITHSDGRIIARGTRNGKPVATVIRDTRDEASDALYFNAVRNAQPQADAR